jgi:hypothetical protein
MSILYRAGTIAVTYWLAITLAFFWGAVAHLTRRHWESLGSSSHSVLLCLGTSILFAASIIHPDIPKPNESMARRAWSFFKLWFVGAVFPELLCVCALVQWVHATRFATTDNGVFHLYPFVPKILTVFQQNTLD